MIAWLWWACAGQPTEPPPPVVLRARSAVHDARPRYVGVVVAAEEAVLAAQVAGTFGPRGASLGAAVAAGEVLGAVEVPTLAAELEAARAAVRSAEAGRGLAAVEVGHAEQLGAAVRTLVAAGAGAEAELDQASLDVDRARAEGRRTAAGVDARRAELERLVAQDAARAVVAPFAGRVGGWLVRPGERVEVGDPVVRLSTPDRLEVRFAVPVAAATRLEGRPIRAIADGRWIPGVVTHVAPEVDLASQLVFVEASLEAGLTAGEACEVEVDDAAGDAVGEVR